MIFYIALYGINLWSESSWKQVKSVATKGRKFAIISLTYLLRWSEIAGGGPGAGLTVGCVTARGVVRDGGGVSSVRARGSFQSGTGDREMFLTTRVRTRVAWEIWSDMEVPRYRSFYPCECLPPFLGNLCSLLFRCCVSGLWLLSKCLL